MEVRVGKKIKCLSTKIGRKLHSLDSIISLENLSGENGFIIHFLRNNKDKKIYQKDIEKNFGITRSTASKTLSLMEVKGIIERRGCDGDGRLKEIVLTDLGEKFALDVSRDIDEFDNKLEACLTKEEIDQFYAIVNKLEKRLEEI